MLKTPHKEISKAESRTEGNYYQISYYSSKNPVKDFCYGDLKKPAWCLSTFFDLLLLFSAEFVGNI
jgi:hypothetical protein